MTLHYLMRAQLDHGLIRAWTGHGSTTITEPIALDGSVPGEEATYTDGAYLVSVGNNTVTFGFDGRAMVGTPVGGRTVDLFALGVPDDGDARVLPAIRRGILTAPMLNAGVYTVTVAPRTYAAAEQQWSHEEQDRLHEGDTFLSQMRALSKGIQGIHFPEVPNFEPSGDYDTTAIAGSSGRGNPSAGLAAPASIRTPGLVQVGAQAPTRLTLASTGAPRGV